MSAKNETDKLAEIIRRAIYLGAGTIAYTQEGMSKALEENLKLPKEVAQGIVAQIDRGKKDLVDSITVLVSNYLSSLNLVDILQRSLHGLEVDVSMKIKYPNAPKSTKRSQKTPDTPDSPD